MRIPVSNKMIRAERKCIQGLELCAVGNVDPDSDSIVAVDVAAEKATEMPRLGKPRMKFR